MAKAPKTPKQTEQPSQEDIEALALTDDGADDDFQLDEEQTDDDITDDDDDQLNPPNTAEQMVPISRLNEVIGERDQARNLLDHLSTVVRPQPAQPAQPQRPAWERPNDNPDQRQARAFVGETLEPVLDAKLGEIRQQQHQLALATLLFQQEQDARGMFHDYGKYAQAIKGLVQSFIPAMATLPPGVNLFESAYHIVKGQEESRRAPVARRNQAVRRAAPAAAGEARPPARVAPQRGGTPLSADRVANMSLKEMEQYLNKKNARV